MDVKALHQAAKKHYWDAKDLPAARRLLEAGIDLAKTQDLFDQEKAMNYDLASFCWPGWDEAGIVIGEDDLAAGEAAANENLRLAEALKKPDGPLANAWFMVGGYHLARRRYPEARAAFEQYARFSSGAGQLLANGYIALVDGYVGGSFDLEAATQGMRDEGSEDAAAFADQLEAAVRVFGRP